MWRVKIERQLEKRRPEGFLVEAFLCAARVTKCLEIIYIILYVLCVIETLSFT